VHRSQGRPSVGRLPSRATGAESGGRVPVWKDIPLPFFAQRYYPIRCMVICENEYLIECEAMHQRSKRSKKPYGYPLRDS